MTIAWLDPLDSASAFPSVEEALSDPEGLLAVGGDLSTERLLRAYRTGIFPWYEEGQPILWWSPDPRTVLYPENLKISRSLGKTLRNKPWAISFDQAFSQTLSACAEPRAKSQGTWITPQMQEAYCRLHAEGYAHSVEVWDEKEALIGGLYGVAIGRLFSGESMFSRKPDASKVALVFLARHLHAWDYPLIDCQVSSPHLDSLGAQPISRQQYIEQLNRWCTIEGHPYPWEVDPTLAILNGNDLYKGVILPLI